MTREEILLEGIDAAKPGVEIGPGFRPLAPKASGYSTKTVDYTTAENLKVKYANQGVDVSRIEEVDVIWNEGQLSDLFGQDQVDWILASHVLEHVPDLIGFLQSCEKILKVGGVLSLAIPDKRYCFDCRRQVSSLSRIIDVHEAGAARQTLGACMEYYLKVCLQDGALAWNQGEEGIKIPLHSLAELRNAAEKTRKGIILDIHNWVFTDQTFFESIQDLQSLGFIKLKIKTFVGTKGHEFFIQLEKKP